MPLLVVAGHGPSLLGRDWLVQLKLNALARVIPCQPIRTYFANEHKAVFKDELGEAVGVTAKLHVSNNTKPNFTGPDRYPIH